MTNLQEKNTLRKKTNMTFIKIILLIIMTIITVFDAMVVVIRFVKDDYKSKKSLEIHIEDDLECFLRAEGAGSGYLLFSAVIGAFVLIVIHQDGLSNEGVIGVVCFILMSPFFTLPHAIYLGYIFKCIRSGLWEKANADFKGAQMLDDCTNKYAIHNSFRIGKEYIFIRHATQIFTREELSKVQVYYQPLTDKAAWGWFIWAEIKDKGTYVMYHFGGAERKDYDELVLPVILNIERILSQGDRSTDSRSKPCTTTTPTSTT